MNPKWFLRSRIHFALTTSLEEQRMTTIQLRLRKDQSDHEGRRFTSQKMDVQFRGISRNCSGEWSSGKTPAPRLQLKEDNTPSTSLNNLTKVLGVLWNVRSDEYYFNLTELVEYASPPPPNTHPTPRSDQLQPSLQELKTNYEERIWYLNRTMLRQCWLSLTKWWQIFNG